VNNTLLAGFVATRPLDHLLRTNFAGYS